MNIEAILGLTYDSTVNQCHSQLQNTSEMEKLYPHDVATDVIVKHFLDQPGVDIRFDVESKPARLYIVAENSMNDSVIETYAKVISEGKKQKRLDELKEQRARLDDEINSLIA